MQSDTPNSGITARAALSGNWGKSIGVCFIYILLLIGLTIVDDVLYPRR